MTPPLQYAQSHDCRRQFPPLFGELKSQIVALRALCAVTRVSYGLRRCLAASYLSLVAPERRLQNQKTPLPVRSDPAAVLATVKDKPSRAPEVGVLDGVSARRRGPRADRDEVVGLKGDRPTGKVGNNKRRRKQRGAGTAKFEHKAAGALAVAAAHCFGLCAITYLQR